MKLVAPLDRGWHRPLRIADGPSDTGPRLGGRAPAVRLPSLTSTAQYVLTFPFAADPDLAASVFVNCSFDDLLEAMNGGLQSDDRIVVILHPPCGRGETSSYASPLSSHPLVVGGVMPDDIDDERGGTIIESAHKLGGRPFCIQEPELEGAARLLDQGYIQALQLSSSPDDALVAGEWPFADGMFNLFLHPTGEQAMRWAFQK